MKLEDTKKLVSQIEEILRECGDIILNANRTEEMVDEKEGHANFVTTYDTKVQNIIEERLSKIIPSAAFVGEEGEQITVPREGLVFIVDPIDGTTNFIHDMHMSCISVGVLENFEQLCGVIYNPYLDEMYTAIKGNGAYCNGKRLSVSDGPLSKGLVIFGTAPYYKELSKKSFDLAYEMLNKSADVRRGGSAAIDMCTVAAGRADMYFELRLCPWDFAAGSLMVTEAGGIITQVDGSPLEFDKKCSAFARGKGVKTRDGSLFAID